MAEIIRNDPSPAELAAAASSSVLPEDIRESIALGSFTSISGQPSSLSNLAFGMTAGNTNLAGQNAVGNQQASNQLGVTVIGSTVERVASISPMEATAAVKLDTGNDLAEQLADIKTIITGFGGKWPSPRTPRIRPNPNGGSFVTVTEQSFPLVINLANNLRRPFVARGRKGGMILFLKRSNFPFLITHEQQPSDPKARVNLTPGQFPVTFKLGTAASAAVADTRTVESKNFPVQVNVVLLNA